LRKYFPNPGKGKIRITYELNEAKSVELIVYDISGKPVRKFINEMKEAGNHEVIFDTNGLTSGTYFYKFKAGNRVETKKVVVVR
jgi:hypothetical protein